MLQCTVEEGHVVAFLAFEVLHVHLLREVLQYHNSCLQLPVGTSSVKMFPGLN